MLIHSFSTCLFIIDGTNIDFALIALSSATILLLRTDNLLAKKLYMHWDDWRWHSPNLLQILLVYETKFGKVTGLMHLCRLPVGPEGLCGCYDTGL